MAPLLGGLFSGDVDRLSVAATFPELATWEREHGEPDARGEGGRRGAPGRRLGAAAAPMFLRLRGGLERLTGALAERLGADVRTGNDVTEIRSIDGGWRPGQDRR